MAYYGNAAWQPTSLRRIMAQRNVLTCACLVKVYA